MYDFYHVGDQTMQIQGKKTGKIEKTAFLLRQELAASTFIPGSRYFSAREIAERFGLSRPTAHEVLNLMVRENLLYRVRGSGTFVRSCQLPQQYRIALLDTPAMPVPQSLYEVFAARIDRMTEELQKHHCQVQVISYFELRDPVRALELLRSFDGILSANTYIDPYSIELFQTAGKPLVVFGHFYEMPIPFSQVFGDMLIGMRKALSMLPGSLLKNAIIFTENPILAKLWQQCLSEFGVDTDKLEVVTIDLQKRSLECYKYVRVHCKSLVQKIILTTTDGLAYNIIDAFMLEGYHPGKDFALISCGDRESQGFRFAEKPLITSVGIEEKKIISQAIQVLLMQIKNDPEVIHQARIPSHLSVRESFTENSLISISIHKETKNK